MKTKRVVSHKKAQKSQNKNQLLAHVAALMVTTFYISGANEW
jgi:hypothetical protein